MHKVEVYPRHDLLPFSSREGKGAGGEYGKGGADIVGEKNNIAFVCKNLTTVMYLREAWELRPL